MGDLEKGAPEPAVPFGLPMRSNHFLYDKAYTPLNHGSYGAFPAAVRDYRIQLQDQIEARPDPVIRNTLPPLLEEARAAVAPLLGVPTNEVVFVPNATTAVNTVLRNLVFEEGDVIIYFSTAYGACEKTIDYICETTPLQSTSVMLEYPMEDVEVVQKFNERVRDVFQRGRKVKIAMFDTVLAFPGVRMPWEALVKACKAWDILSLIDGAHGIGHIDLSHLGEVGPDFFTSNCYKWLYVPRSCAIFHVPTRNHHLIRSSVPTSWGFRSLPAGKVEEHDPLHPKGNSPFVELFAFVATNDTTPYLCVPEALKFREITCGGEANIRQYCQHISQVGGSRMAQILGTEVMDNKTRTLTKCCFANVRLPLIISRHSSSDRHGSKAIQGQAPISPVPDKQGEVTVEEAPVIVKWIMERLQKEFDTHIPAKIHAGAIWVRLSGQIYLADEDFGWAARVLKELCERVLKGEGRS